MQKEIKKGGPYEDLREAIAKTAFVEASSGAVIIESEHSGARGVWLFDFRALMLQARWLDRYAEIFWERYADKLPFQVGGLETAGISLVAAIVMKSVQRGTPVNGFYIRKSRKRQGLMKNIEGTLTDEPIIFVDDLINSGQSVNKQIDILLSAGKRVTDVFEILAFRPDETYSFFRDKGVTLTHLFTPEDFGAEFYQRSATVPEVSFDVVWKYAAPNPSLHLVVQKSTPTLDDARVFFGCDDGIFRALDQKTGAVLWEYAVGRHPVGKGILSSPKVHKGTVYFGAYDGSVYAFDTTTGKLLWRYDDADWVGSSPDIAGDLGLIYIGLEFGLWNRRGGIVALDLKTGQPKWTVYHPSLTHGSPLYIKEEGLVVIGSNDGILYAYDASSGALRWSFGTGGDIKTCAAYDAKRRTVITGSMSGTMFVLSAETGAPIFARNVGPVYSTPLVHSDTLYISSLDKCLYAIDCTNWKDKWIYETSGRIFASPAVVDGSVWIGSNDGRLYEIDSETGRLKHFYQATERILTKIATKDHHFYFATVANELYCLKRLT